MANAPSNTGIKVKNIRYNKFSGVYTSDSLLELDANHQVPKININGGVDNYNTGSISDLSKHALLDITFNEIVINGNNYIFSGWRIQNGNYYIEKNAGDYLSADDIQNQLHINGNNINLNLNAIWEKVSNDKLNINYTMFNGDYIDGCDIITTPPSVENPQFNIEETDAPLVLKNIPIKFITIRNSSLELTTYEFCGWQVGSNQTITVDEGATITWRDLVDKYANDGIVDVKPIWNPLSKENTQVEFYLRYDGKIANYEGMTESYSYDSSRYTSNLAIYDIICKK